MSDINIFAVYGDEAIQIKYEHFIFSGGETHIKLNKEDLESTKNLVISHIDFDCNLQNSESIMKLLLLKEAIDLHFSCQKWLFIPYMPYGRQDRRCEPNEAFSLKVFANLINMCQFNGVVTVDAHSDVGPALIDKCYNAKMDYDPEMFSHVDVVVSPDSGGVKRAFNFAQQVDKPLIKADKLRDTKTGEILSTEVYSDDLTDKICIIVDDICDGGRTFIELAKALKNKGAKSVELIVTHGIFSRGLLVFDDLIDVIYTGDSITQTGNFWHENRHAKVILNRFNTVVK